MTSAVSGSPTLGEEVAGRSMPSGTAMAWQALPEGGGGGAGGASTAFPGTWPRRCSSKPSASHVTHRSLGRGTASVCHASDRLGPAKPSQAPPAGA